jgi:F420-0:gamma-glutamyl ligase-like protein
MVSNLSSIDLERDVSVQVLVLVVDSDQLVDILLVHFVNLALSNLFSRPDGGIGHFLAHN